MNMTTVSLRHLQNETKVRLTSCLSSLPAYESFTTNDELFSTMRTEFEFEGYAKYTFVLVHQAGGTMVFGTYIVMPDEVVVMAEDIRLTHLKEGYIETFELGMLTAMINFSENYRAKERNQHVG